MLPIAFVGSFMTVNITATVRQDVRAIRLLHFGSVTA
jgi:hypothetical protein